MTQTNRRHPTARLDLLASGLGVILVSAATKAGAPINDNCENALAVPVPGMVSGDTTEATTDSAGTCIVSNTSAGVWYLVTGTGNTITATTCDDPDLGGSADYDTKISVYCADCSELTCVAGNDDECPGGSDSLLSTVTWCSQAGTQYLVLVHGFINKAGSFQLAILEGAPCAPGFLCEVASLGRCCVPAPCPADTNNDGAVDVGDLIAIISGWGDCDQPPAPCPGDTNTDGVVGVLDLIAVINGWGDCDPASCAQLGQADCGALGDAWAAGIDCSTPCPN